MRQLFRATLLTAFIAAMGCGGGPEPDVPASLTPEMEQEILQQVEGTAAEEEGKT